MDSNHGPADGNLKNRYHDTYQQNTTKKGWEMNETPDTLNCKTLKKKQKKTGFSLFSRVGNTIHFGFSSTKFLAEK